MDKRRVELNSFRMSAWALTYAIRRWPALLMVIVTMLLKTGLEVLKPWPMKIIVDNVLGREALPAALSGFLEYVSGEATPYQLLAWCVSAMVSLVLMSWLVGLGESFAGIALGQRMFYELAGTLFAYMQRLSLRFHRSKSVGDSIRRVTTDCACVSTIVRNALVPTASSLISLVLMFAILWQLDPLLTSVSMLAAPYMAFVVHRYAAAMQQRSYEQKHAEGQLYDVVEQALTAIPVVQAFRAEPRGEAQFHHRTRSILEATFRSTHVDLQFRALIGLATVAGTALVIWIGGSHVLRGELTVGSLLVFVSYLRSLYGPLESIMYTSSTIQEAAGSAQRVLEILRIDPDVQDAPLARPLSSIRGHIRFENITFGYNPLCPVLHDINLEMRPGETVAVVGPSGAGKTTLAGLLPRFFDPQRGRVLLDGEDIRQFQVNSLRGQLSIVLQEPFLFPISIAENIAFSRPDASRDEIEAAAKAARVHDFIDSLPDGYETRVGERGATLSGGERQRISIARALLRNAPLLILDEPTSALDLETESLFLEAMRELIEKPTTLVIAHRLSTILAADKIAVLDAGKLVELGTHDQLLAARGLYHRFHTLQFGSPEEVGVLR